jgi:hypothetical protein
VKLAAALILIFAFWGLALKEFLISQRMFHQLNAALPAEERFEYLGWGPLKSESFWTKYKQMFPNSKDQEKSIALFMGMGVCLLGFMAVVLS